LSNLRVKDLMVKAEERDHRHAGANIERAASLMTQNKIGCLPVIENGQVVIGILTEQDLLRAFQEMLGLPARGCG